MLTVDKSDRNIKSLQSNSTENFDSLFICNKKALGEIPSLKFCTIGKTAVAHSKEKSTASTTNLNCFSPFYLLAIPRQIHT
jgi:hypothetical protein